jgi:hypothetical protein
MARKRSTVDVALVLEKANAALAGDYGDAGYRLGIASLLETVLHAAGQYKGYNHLGWMNGGCEAWRAAGQPADNTPFVGDDSRRFYYS